MSTRTAPSMAQRGGGGPSSPWHRPSAIGSSSDRGFGNSRQESRPNNSRGYSIPRGTNTVRRPSFTPPPGRQGCGDNSFSSYHRNDSNSNHNRHRESDRDNEYNRWNPNEYRPNEFERGHRPPARYVDDDRDRNFDRGMGYETNRSTSYDDRRSMGESWDRNSHRNDRGGNYNESRESTPYNSNANNNINRRDMMGGGSNHYDNDRKRDNGRNNGNLENTNRVLRDRQHEPERRGNFAREHERELRHNSESLDYQRRQQQRPYSDMVDLRGYRHQNESDHYPPRFSTGREDRNNGFRNGNFSRNEYNDRDQEHEHQQPRQRWEAPSSTTSRGIDNFDTNDRSGFSNYRMGMGERNREGADSRRSEWTRKHQVEARGYVMDAKSRLELSDKHNSIERGWGKTEGEEKSSGEPFEHRHAEFTTLPLEDQRSSAVTASARSSHLSEYNDDNNARKRQREDGEELNRLRIASKIDRRGEASPAKSSAFISNPIGTNLKEESDQNKKIKLATSTSTAATTGSSSVPTSNNSSLNRGIESEKQDSKNATKTGTAANALSSSITAPRAVAASSTERKIHNKASTKTISAKAVVSLSLTKKHEIQVKQKPTNQLGIPMRWLKPKAKPKPPVKKNPPKLPEDSSKSNKIPTKKSTTRPSSPSSRLVTDSSEGSSIVSSKNNNNNTKGSPSSSVLAKKHKGESVPAAIVTKKKSQKTSNPKTKQTKTKNDLEEEPEDEWNSEAESEESDGNASESDTDDDEVLGWASEMLGVPESPSSIRQTDSNDSLESNNQQNSKGIEASKTKSPKLKIRLSAALKLKLTESIQSDGKSSNEGLSEENGDKLEATLKKLERRKKKREKLKALSEKINDERPEFDHEKAKKEIEEERRKREEAKPLTAKELRTILKDDAFSGGGNHNNWVRRSRRQPNKNLLNSKAVRILVDSLKHNDSNIRVLKMKKFINDPNTPCVVIEAILNAMEENTNCEALYIQVRSISYTCH